MNCLNDSIAGGLNDGIVSYHSHHLSPSNVRTWYTSLYQWEELWLERLIYDETLIIVLLSPFSMQSIVEFKKPKTHWGSLEMGWIIHTLYFAALAPFSKDMLEDYRDGRACKRKIAQWVGECTIILFSTMFIFYHVAIKVDSTFSIYRRFLSFCCLWY